MSLSPQDLIESFGLIGIAVIVFAESGLLIGFFLPGDSLLFTAGAIAAGVFSSISIHLNLAVLLPVVAIAAIAGDQVGYLFGSRVGGTLWKREDSRFFKQAHLAKAQAFFESHGPRALVLARFIPVVRTFTPIVAGAGSMNYKTFFTYNVIGGVLWAVGVTLLGYFFGQVGLIREHIEFALVGIVIVSLIPVAIELTRHRRNQAGA
ncbi:MAG TPA: VTT domain-containing protein [Microthrixaceae bacterium]|nr:VTT domain-containing protein [Microthrixaceae bacterium]